MAAAQSEYGQSPYLDSENENKLPESLHSAVGNKKGADGGFKKQIWDLVPKAMRQAFPYVSFEQQQVTTKAEGLKKKYREHQQCFSASGFVRDPERRKSNSTTRSLGSLSYGKTF